MGKSDGITILSRIFYIYIFTQEKSFSSYKKDGLTWGRELIPLALQRSFWLSSRKLKSLIWGLSHVQVTEYMAKNLNDLCGVFLKLQLRLLNTRPSAFLFLFFFFFFFLFRYGVFLCYYRLWADVASGALGLGTGRRREREKLMAFVRPVAWLEGCGLGG